MQERKARDFEENNIDTLLRNLDIDSLPVEVEPVTGLLARRAPEGKTFEVTGKFAVHAQSCHADDFPIPLESRELFFSDEENIKLFDRYLKKANYNEELAWEYFTEDDQESRTSENFPTSFLADWLVLSRAEPRTKFAKPTTQITLRGPVLADVMKTESDINIPQEFSDIFSKYEYFIKNDFNVFWYQQFVNLRPEESQISLIDKLPNSDVIYLPKIKIDSGLILPVDSRSKSTDYLRVLSFLGLECSADDLQEIIRGRRLEGEPLADDPLKDMIFLE